MPDPFAGEFDDVLAALQATELAMPATQTLSPPRPAPAPELLLDPAELIARDGDEAWSLALAFLNDEQAAWDALVDGFAAVAGGKPVSSEDCLLAIGRAALDAAQRLAKAGALPEAPGAPDARLDWLLRADLSEVPPRALHDAPGLQAAVEARLEAERSQAAGVDAVRLRITVACAYCHDGLDRQQAAFCASCLAPHHADCFAAHGRCSAPGCDATQLVRPHDVPRERRRAWPWLVTLLAGGLAAAAWGLTASSQATAARKQPNPAETAETRVASAEASTLAAAGIDPALLAAARARDLERRARRDAELARNQATRAVLNEGRTSLNFDGTPLLECIDVFRDATKLNLVVSPDARELIEGEQVTVTLRLSEISFDNALKLILCAHESLDYELERGLIRITAGCENSVAEQLLEAYEVGDLLSERARARGGASLDADQLIMLIDERFAEGDFSGSATVAGGTLVLRGSYWEHVQVRKLLETLRAPADDTQPTRPAWIDALETQLRERRITVNFPQTQLIEVVSFIQDVTGANLVLSAAVDGEQPVTLHLREVPALEVLEVLAQQVGLVLHFANETLMLVTPDEARGPCTLRVLEARDLSRWFDAETLKDLVLHGAGEDLWEAPASLRVHRDQVFVLQTRAGHAAVADVLARLRLSKSRPEGTLPEPPR